MLGSQLPEQQSVPWVQLFPVVVQPPSPEGTTTPWSSLGDAAMSVLPEVPLSQLHAGKLAAAAMKMIAISARPTLSMRTSPHPPDCADKMPTRHRITNQRGTVQ
jgi:hypothetical protein